MDTRPVRVPITSEFDLHSVASRDVKPVVEEYLIEARLAGITPCASFTAAVSGSGAKSSAPS